MSAYRRGVSILTDKGLKAGPELVVEGDDVAEAEAVDTEGAAQHSHHTTHRQLDVPELDTDVLGQQEQDNASASHRGNVWDGLTKHSQTAS